MNTSIILNTDSYKTSQYLQYQEGTEYVYSYVEARGSEGFDDPYDDTSINESVFIGAQIFNKEYLSKPITREDIDFAELFLAQHGVPFNKEGWEYILAKHNGYLPLKVDTVPEGSVVPLRNVLATVVNTDPKCAWLTSYIETALLRSIWYGTTVATNSREIKKVLKGYFDSTSDDPEGINFKLHDFGARGVSSLESAGIGAFAHIVNFMGTDTIEGILYAMRYYGQKDMPAFSIPASEHSTITSWGKEGEAKAYKNMLDKFAKPEALLAIVSDSYDLENAVKNIFGKELKQDILDSGATVVIRPDSGDPTSMVLQTVMALEEAFGATINTKGYKVLNPAVRVIQGDGINIDTIRSILTALKINSYSIDNIAFGMGGALLQQVNRDTLQFAMKCSAVVVNGQLRDVYKAPKTDMRKASKRGIQKLYVDQHGKYITATTRPGMQYKNVLKTIYKDGKVTKEWTMDEVRENAKI